MSSLMPIKVYHGFPGISSSPTSAHTVAAGKKLIVKHIRISNITSNNATFTMQTGANLTGPPVPYFANALTVKANDVVIFDVSEVLEAGEQIVLSQGTAAALHVQISGVEVTL